MSSLFCREAGSGQRVLVLLHGFGGNHRTWDKVVALLSSEAKIMAYDLPGHGASLGFPEAGPVKVAAKAILADLAERGIDRFHIAGHSMGGAVAAVMGLIAGARTASITLAAPGGFGEEINGRLLRRYGAARTADEIRACLEMMTGWGNAVGEERVAELTAMRAGPGQAEQLEAIAASITRDGRQGQLPRDGLAGLTMPVSVIWGRLDAVLPAHQSEDLPPLFSRHVIADAGHMLPDEKPEIVAEIIRRQLS